MIFNGVKTIDGSFSIGIDLGGTKISAGLCSNEKIIKKIMVSTEASREPFEILKTMFEVAQELISDVDRSHLLGIGVGAAGQIHSATNSVIFSPNLRWKNIPLGEWLSQKLSLPVRVINDVRAATMAEYRFGAGRGLTSFVNIFLGTGIGSGLILNGKLLEGFSNSAGEIGHICLDQNGPACGCGKKGCFESYSSGKGLENYVKSQLEQGTHSKILELVSGDLNLVTGKIIGAAAKENDHLALGALKRVGNFLGLALANIHTFLNPQTILIGGGLMALREFFIPALNESLKRHVLPVADREELYKPAAFENDAVIIGSSILFNEPS